MEEVEYITVLNHIDGRIYQYENLEHLTVVGMAEL